MTHQARKLAVHCHNFVRWKRNVPLWPEQALRAPVCFLKKHDPHTCFSDFSSPACTMALWLVSLIHGKRKRLPGADLTMILYHMKTPSEGGQLPHSWHSPWHPCRIVVMEYPPNGQNFEQSTCLVLEGEMARFIMVWASQVVLVVKNTPANAGDMRHRFNSWFRKIPQERKWHRFQYSCLENPMERGA